MSRYMVNKLIWEVDTSDEALARFKADPYGFVESWQEIESPTPPVPQGGHLTEAERLALVGKDYGALYALGVNPFLLWQFARSVSVPDEMAIEELVNSFREAVAPHGYPDFHT